LEFAATSFKYSLPIDIIQGFIIDLKLKGCTDVTVKQYLNDVAFYQRHLSKSILDVTVQDLRNYLIHLKIKHNHKNSSLARKIAFLRTFYGFLTEHEILDENPAKSIKFPKIKDAPIPFLSERDIQRILRATDNPRDRLIIKIFFYEGLRLGELHRLAKKDINFTEGTILVHGKGDKQRIIPLHEELSRELSKYSKSRHLEERLFQIVKRQIQEVVERAAAKVGIHCYPHLLRHSFSANLFKKTKNIWLVSKMLGHSKLETTVKYLRSLNVLDDFRDEYEEAFKGVLS